MFGGKKKKAAKLLETGAKGVGTIQRVQDTGMTVNDNPRVKISVSVEPLEGGPPVELQKTATVSRVDIPRAGDRHPVWYDPADLKNWVYVTPRDEAGQQSLRQAFGPAADSFVGMGGANAPAPAAPAPPAAEDPLDRLKKLDELRASGALTDAEFEAQKAKLLATM
jgi:hypothetical protein